MELMQLSTTLDERERARQIARTVLERRLAACAQISALDSLYRWRGELCEAPEFRLTLKTTAAAMPALQAAVRELHPYELPEIVSQALACDDPAYCAWVEHNSDGG